MPAPAKHSSYCPGIDLAPLLLSEEHFVKMSAEDDFSRVGESGDDTMERPHSADS